MLRWLWWKSKFELETMKVGVESLVQVKGKWGQHSHPHRVRVVVFIKKWLVCLAQKEKALREGGKLIYMDIKCGGVSLREFERLHTSREHRNNRGSRSRMQTLKPSYLPWSPPSS